MTHQALQKQNGHGYIPSAYYPLKTAIEVVLFYFEIYSTQNGYFSASISFEVVLFYFEMY